MPPKTNTPPPEAGAPKRKAGRPRKEEGEGTEKQQKQREYMRNYVASINDGIKELAKDEDECLQHLDRILKENNYQGWVSIEDGMNGMEEMAESLAFLRMMSQKYFS